MLAITLISIGEITSYELKNIHCEPSKLQDRNSCCNISLLENRPQRSYFKAWIQQIRNCGKERTSCFYLWKMLPFAISKSVKNFSLQLSSKQQFLFRHKSTDANVGK